VLRNEKDGPELYFYAQNNYILKRTLARKVPLRLHLKFSDQLIEALTGG
jgi:hypothetical protein